MAKFQDLLDPIVKEMFESACAEGVSPEVAASLITAHVLRDVESQLVHLREVCTRVETIEAAVLAMQPLVQQIASR
jgi:hypothetical protein